MAISVYVFVCLFVCLYVSLLAYLKNRMSKYHEIFCVMSPVTSSDESAISYVLPVLWMTSCFHVMGPMGQNQARGCFVEFARWWHRGRSLMSTTALPTVASRMKDIELFVYD